MDKQSFISELWSKTSEAIKTLAQKLLHIYRILIRNAAANYIMIALLGIGIGLLSLLLGTSGFGMSLFKAYFSYPMVLLLNLIPPVLMIFFFYFAFGKAFIAFAITGAVVIIIGFIHFFKVQIQGAPLIFSDYAVAREAFNVFSKISVSVNWRIYFAIFLYVCGVLFALFVLKSKPPKIAIRAGAALVAAIIAFGLYTYVYNSRDIYEKATVTEDWRHTFSFVRRYSYRGFLYPFIHSISTYASAQNFNPPWFDEELAVQLTMGYTDADIPPDKAVNLIIILMESYADLSQYEQVELLVDVYAPFHRLQEESITGGLVSNIFGGWTIDTERLVMTGDIQLRNYTAPSNSFVRYLSAQGYSTEGFHPGEAWFYDRVSVNSNFGFDRYLFIDDFPEGSRDDAFFFSTVLDLYEGRDRSRPYFAYHVSYQNHVSLRGNESMMDSYAISRDGLSDEGFVIINNYLSGIYDTSWRLEVFLDQLRHGDDPVVVAVYGDHKPSLGDVYGGGVYSELGINMDVSTEDGFYNFFGTPFLIWANDSAKSVLGNDFTGDVGDFSPFFLMGEVFSQLSWVGPGYMQALRDFRECTDIYNYHGYTSVRLREDGELIVGPSRLSPSGLEAYNRFRQIEWLRRR